MQLGLDFLRDMLVPLISAAVIAALICVRLIPYLKKIKSTQTIHEDVPEAHLIKSGTPTMGGIAIVIAVIVGAGLSAAIFGGGAKLIPSLAMLTIFAFVGFIDDYTKVVNKRNLGLTARQKIIVQVVVALLFAVYYVFIAKLGTLILIPFTHMYVDIGYWIIPYIAFIVTAMVNAVNLTDGLDGLAASNVTLVSLFFPLVIFTARQPFADFAGDGAFFFAAAGAMIGFLVFNRYPAKIFMGDTGSLAIGGGLAAAAIMTHVELYLPIMGLLFVFEALSDIIQVTSYKLRHGKRVFRMAPLHHHFELGGWKETKVVKVFTIFTFVLCVITLAVLIIESYTVFQQV